MFWSGIPRQVSCQSTIPGHKGYSKIPTVIRHRRKNFKSIRTRTNRPQISCCCVGCVLLLLLLSKVDTVTVSYDVIAFWKAFQISKSIVGSTRSMMPAACKQGYNKKKHERECSFLFSFSSSFSPIESLNQYNATLATSSRNKLVLSRASDEI